MYILMQVRRACLFICVFNCGIVNGGVDYVKALREEIGFCFGIQRKSGSW